MKLKRLKKALIYSLSIITLCFVVLIALIYFKQDQIVQSQINSLNSTFPGEIRVGDVHLAPFANFPYVSLKVDDVSIREGKEPESAVILDVADIYLGFQLWDIVRGKFDIQTLKVEEGVFDIVMHEDGSTNLERAIDNGEAAEEGSALEVHLKKIVLENLAFHYLKEEDQQNIEVRIFSANGGFNTNERITAAHVDSDFELNIIQAGDTGYFKHKHFEFHTDFNFDHESGLLSFAPSGIVMEHGDFLVEGSIQTKEEMYMDLKLQGSKPSFDLFFAFAPHDIIPVLERYNNAGNIYLNAEIVGPTTNGRQPFIKANFGADEAFLENSIAQKKMDDMGFSGSFTNGEGRNLESMEFSMQGIRANLEEGEFLGNLRVKNFEQPEIEMDLKADFDIPFLVGFLNLDEVEDVRGRVILDMKFHDIIDIDQPQAALEELNQAYFASLKVENLALESASLPASLSRLDIDLEMQGKKAELKTLAMNLGNSDIDISGTLSDLPAIVHHANIPVEAQLHIASKNLDIAQLTKYSPQDSSGMNERIQDLRMDFSFEALANAFTEFKHLPKGEFFIENLYADLEHYPHTLHDFHADVLIDDEDLSIIDFTGFIDDSDFHFNGLVHDYSAWMAEELNGEVAMDVNLKAKLLRFEDLFSYGGENYVPKEYRHEEIENLHIHLLSKLDFKENKFQGVALQLDQFEGKMHVHPLRFENFSGNFDFRDEHIIVQNFKGELGRSDFDIDLNYYLGENEVIKLRDNAFSLKSKYFDFDALSNYDLKPKNTVGSVEVQKSEEDVAQHAEAFNIYELPFSDMRFDVDIAHFLYHRLDLKQVKGEMRTTKDHFIYLDTLSMNGAGGQIAMNGYFNGSNPDKIYFKPNMELKGVDLDQLLFKFENFGQDAIVSENLHGKLNASITGNVRVYPDFVPDLDQSEVHLDAQVLDGRLENYDPVMMLSDYFGDKDLTSIKFDTLQNHMDIQNGRITIPNMTIESTLGHMDISGTQSMTDSMEYFARIPWSLVKGAAKNKIFGTKEREEEDEDEIVEIDPKKKVKYLNVRISGTLDDYKVGIGKAKK